MLQQPYSESPDMELPQRTWPALLFSVCFHLILFLSLVLLWDSAPNGTGQQVNRSVGIAMIHRLPDRDRYEDVAEKQETNKQQEEQAETSQSNPSSSSAAAPPAEMIPPIDLEGILSSIKKTPAPVSGSGLAGETSLDAGSFDSNRPNNQNVDAGDATTMVFGVSGSGSRFVYVFDRSDSMNGNGGKPLKAAKAEMIRSLKSLGERQRFQIIFYNDKPKPFQIGGMPLQMITADKSNLQLAERYVNSVTAFGSTEHESALKLALRMDPDVIFFLTDARIPRLSVSQLSEIRRRASRSGTTIHAIEFGAEPIEPSSSFLKELAAQNGGKYHYVDARTLGRSTQ